MKKSPLLIKFLFLFYFLFYTVSPLSYSPAGHLPENNLHAHAGQDASVSIHVLLLELFCSKISHQADASPVRIIIKKTRSVVNDPFKLKTLSPEKSSIFGDLSLPSVPRPTGPAVLSDGGTNLSSAFFRVPSGLSPPLS